MAEGDVCWQAVSVNVIDHHIDGVLMQLGF